MTTPNRTPATPDGPTSPTNSGRPIGHQWGQPIPNHPPYQPPSLARQVLTSRLATPPTRAEIQRLAYGLVLLSVLALAALALTRSSPGEPATTSQTTDQCCDSFTPVEGDTSRYYGPAASLGHNTGTTR